MPRKKKPLPENPSLEGLELPKPAPLPWRPEDLTPGKIEHVKLLLDALESRRAESLTLYEPLPAQEEFHKSKAKIRLIRGSNRAGKTLATCVEVARAVCARDPHHKWPDRDGRFYIVAKSQKELGEVIYPKFFKAGAFKMIRDKETNRWRAFRPWKKEDRARVHEAKPAPPLIPPRAISAISWESKGTSVPQKVHLKNGWEMFFMASGAKPIQGPDIDGVLFDEEITDREWFPEMMARLLDRKGKFIWSATPQAGTEHLYAIHQRAEDREPGVEEYFISLADNPFMDEEEKLSLAANYSDDEYNVRILGNYAMSGYMVYPEFSMTSHCCDPIEIPKDWARFMVVDPGRQVCAVLFAAVPPDNEHCYLYDELYIKRATAFEFGEQVYRRAEGFAFEAFIIDHQGGRITEMGSGKEVEMQYSEELRTRRISCQRTGFGFLWGSTDVKGGLEATRSWLRIRPRGTPYLQIFSNYLPNFCWEAKYYHFKRGADGLLSDDPVRKNDHLMACLTAGTMVETLRGAIPIEQVLVDDMVWTRRGFCRVTASGMTQPEAPILRATFSDGRVLEGTAEHPIWTKNRGWVAMASLRYLDRIVTSWENMVNASGLFTADAPIGDTQSLQSVNCESISAALQEDVFTETSGEMPTDQSRVDTTSTTRTKTRSTTNSIISNAFRSQSICPSITKENAQRDSASTSHEFKEEREPDGKNGLLQKQGKLTSRTDSARYGLIESRWSAVADIATSNTPPKTEKELADFVQMPVEPMLESLPESTTRREPASPVEFSLLSIAMLLNEPAPVHVLTVCETGRREPVYDLTVETEHEFFANGVLVHNCFRYLAAFDPKWVEPPPVEPRESEVLQILKRKRKMQNKDKSKHITLGPKGR